MCISAATHPLVGASSVRRGVERLGLLGVLGRLCVHRAVEAHHGFILVDGNGNGSGTRFTVILPKLGHESARKSPRATAAVGRS